MNIQSVILCGGSGTKLRPFAHERLQLHEYPRRSECVSRICTLPLLSFVGNSLDTINPIYILTPVDRERRKNPEYVYE